MNTPKILMMFLGTGDQVDERLHGSLLVAKKLNAHLRVVHTQMDSNSLLPDDLSIPVAARKKFTQMMLDVTSSETQDLREKFKLYCKELDVDFLEEGKIPPQGCSAAWIPIQGLRSTIVGSYGKLADWIIMARPPEGLVTASFEAAVLETGRPVLIIPRQYELPSFDNILVGWNYRAEAVKAMAAAMPLMHSAKSIRVITSSNFKGYHPPIELVSEYLSMHGIDSKSSMIECNPNNAGKELLKQCSENNINLIVIGAYSKRRIRDLLFGDVTRYLLRKSPIPILMVH